MLGFAALDRSRDAVAVWLVSRTDPSEATSTNAVVVDWADPEAPRAVHSLTRDRVVVLTPGSDPTGLPLTHPQPSGLLDDVIAATRSHQQAIVDAIRAYSAARKGQKLVHPSFPPEVALPTQWPETPELRALELAGLLGRAWTSWLVTDGERLRRTTQPRTGKSPWIMPEDLNQSELLALPPGLNEQLTPEPVEAFPG